VTKTDLSSYNNAWFDPGAGTFKRLLWYLVNAVFFDSHALLPYALKSNLLRWFGANMGQGVVIKPHVNIKYPWKLTIGNHSWIGEGVWIDNLDLVSIGDHACISQGALLLTGNHNFKKTTFDLMVKPIRIEEGAWVGAKCVVTQGVTIGSHAVLTAGSIASSDLIARSIYRGNPAVKIKERVIE